MFNILSIGDKLQIGHFKIHSKFNRVINLISDDNLISVVHKDVGAGPINIVLQNINLKEIEYANIERDFIEINDTKLKIDEDKIYNSKIEFLDIDEKKIQENINTLEKHLLILSPDKSLAFLIDESREKHFKTNFEKELVKRFKIATEKIFSSDCIDGIRTIRGLGFGLTPSGDDFIAGMLFALNFVESIYEKNFSKLKNEIYENSKSENIFSNTFLYLAKEGAFFENLKNLTFAITYLEEKEIYNTTKKLISMGETSGTDLGVGFLLTIGNIVDSEESPLYPPLLRGELKGRSKTINKSDTRPGNFQNLFI